MNDLIRAAKLWAKTSQKTGATYYVGWMGGCRVLVMENRDRQGDGDPTHFLLLGDAEAGPAQPEQRPQEPARDDASRVSSPAPAATSSPIARGDGYRGPSRYVRPRDARRRDLLPEDELADDGVDDLYR
jgi:hypothetical protein